MSRDSRVFERVFLCDFVDLPARFGVQDAHAPDRSGRSTGGHVAAVPARRTGSGVDARPPTPGADPRPGAREWRGPRRRPRARARGVGHDGPPRPRDPPRARPAREGPRRRDGDLGPRVATSPGSSPSRPSSRSRRRRSAPRRRALVEPGMAIAISAGTTTHALAARVAEIPGVTVVTNSLRVAEVLYRSGRRDQTVILTGGVRTPSEALVGLVRRRAAALGAPRPRVHGRARHGRARPGFTCPNLSEADTDRALIEAGRRLVVIADHSKWGVIGIASIARLDQADVLVSDRSSTRRPRRRSARSCGEVILVESDEPAEGAGLIVLDDRRTSGAQAASPCPLTISARPGRRAVAGLAAGAAPAPQRADRRVGAGLGRADRPAVARCRGAGAARGTAGLRPGLLPVPRQPSASTGDVNPDYDATFVFTNDFAALRPDTSDARVADGLFRAEGTRGTCRVVCFSPRHDLTLAGHGDEPEIRRIVDVWAEQTTELGRALPLGPGVREPRRGDGRLEPAPARPDLVRRRPAGRGDARGPRRRPRYLAETGRGRSSSTTPRPERGGPRVVARRRPAG